MEEDNQLVQGVIGLEITEEAGYGELLVHA